MALDDHFSGHAPDYARYRPTYSEELFEWLLDQVEGRDIAWDCGTGNGQVAVRLAQDFEQVRGTDMSRAQLDQAVSHPRVLYRACPAERSGLKDGTVDLVTVAAALHWFDLDPFYGEVQRVLKPGGLLAAWTYGPGIVGPPEIVPLVTELIDGLLADDWPERIERVRGLYKTIPFPFQEIAVPPMLMESSMDLEHCVGWLGTMSAIPRHRARTGRDPMPEFRQALERVWPVENGGPVVVAKPMHFRVGHKTSRE